MVLAVSIFQKVLVPVIDPNEIIRPGFSEPFFHNLY
jgi:hypothetical protein